MNACLHLAAPKLFLVIFACICHISWGDTPPSWPDSYIVSGIIELPYAEIKEPFIAYYSKPLNKSRIDYYNDVVQTVQDGVGKNGYGATIKVTPVTTENTTNVKTCFQVLGDINSTVTIQSALPDMTNFTLIKSYKYEDTEQTWQYVEQIEDKKNTYSMTVSVKKNGAVVPTHYEMIGYNTLLGSHYDRYYVTYQNFENTTIPAEKFSNVTAGLTCKNFTDTDSIFAHHRVTMNPIQEFIHNNQQHVEVLFTQYKSLHGKSYTSQREHLSRKDIFRQNLRFIHSTNRAGLGYTLDVNHFADQSHKELSIIRGRQASSKGYNGGQPFYMKSTAKTPAQWDWRLFGAVTPVKDQAVCGSCWSFGTTGTLEGTNFVMTGKLINLSEQELVDCSWGEGNNGCDGGEDWRAYQWVMAHGLSATEDYGNYLGQNGYCSASKMNNTQTVKVSGYVNVTRNNVEALKAALVQYGPISVSIDASVKTFSFYSNGIYYDPKCANDLDGLDHSVLLVGYGIQNGKAYWLIKNSWSTHWGNDGYILMAQQDNNCGVMTIPTYPIIQ